MKLKEACSLEEKLRPTQRVSANDLGTLWVSPPIFLWLGWLEADGISWSLVASLAPRLPPCGETTHQIWVGFCVSCSSLLMATQSQSPLFLLETWSSLVGFFCLFALSNPCESGLWFIPTASEFVKMEWILNEVSQKETNTIWYHLYMESKIWHKWTYPWKRNTFIDAESWLVVAKVKGAWIGSLGFANASYYM